MKLLFIRHGQTDWNLEGRIQGSYDIALNATGIQQAKELSEKLHKETRHISKIYSSPQKRALQTAEVISSYTGVQYVVLEALQEINLGEWEGYSWHEVKEKYPTEYSEWFTKRRTTKPPKGESYHELVNRVLKSVHQIIKENDNDVVIVTHSAVIMCLQCYLTGTDYDKMTKFKTENTAIIEIDSLSFEPKPYSEVRIN